MRARKCIELNCNELAGTPWTPYWCAKHDAERRKRIRKSLTELIAQADDKSAVDQQEEK